MEELEMTEAPLGEVKSDMDAVAESVPAVDIAPQVAPTEEPAVEEAPEAGEEQQPAVDDGRAWYVVHSYSGYENKVKRNLEHRIESMNMHNKIFEVVVPTEEEIEIREGHRRRT